MSDWVQVNNGLQTLPALATATWLQSKIRFDPNNGDIVYLLSAPLTGISYVPVYDVYKSLDAGEHWFLIKDGFSYTASPVTLDIDPSVSTRIYAASNGIGLIKSDDSGETWVTVCPHESFPNLGYDNPVLIDPAASSVMYHGAYKSTNFGAAWASITHPVLAVDGIGDIVYAASGSGLVYSTTGGSTWFVSTPTGITDIRSMAIDPVTPETLYIGCYNFGMAPFAGLYKSVDQGANWTAITGIGTGTSHTVTFISIAASDPNTIYVGTIAGEILVSANGGTSWTNITPNLTGSIFGLACDLANPLIVLASYGLEGVEPYTVVGDGFYRSVDGGANWVQGFDLITTQVKDVITSAMIANICNYYDA